MSQEEFDKELIELKERLSMIMKLLKEENHGYGWNLRRKVKWPIEQLYVRKLRHRLKHRLDAWIKEPELREVEYRKSLEAGPTVHFCELKQGVVLGEEDEAQDEDLMGSLEKAV
jgi:hypothetical protein